MTGLTDTYVSSLEAATVLAIHPMAIQKLLKAGKLRGEKIANLWLIRRADLEEFAKTYVPKIGRPRTKRKYTRRRQLGEQLYTQESATKSRSRATASTPRNERSGPTRRARAGTSTRNTSTKECPLILMT